MLAQDSHYARPTNTLFSVVAAGRGCAGARRRYLEELAPLGTSWARRGEARRPRRARAGEGLLASSTSKVVVNLFNVAIEVPGFTRRDLTP